MAEVISSQARAPELLRRFKGVYLQDGTVISLPASLAQEWQGTGKAGQEAAWRGQVRVDLSSGLLQGYWLQEARTAERSGPAIETPLPVGSLFVSDMGYFTLPSMRQRGERGEFWLSPAKASLSLLDERGCGWDLLTFLRAQTGDEVDVQVRVGKRERLPVRLIAVRVSAQQAQRRRENANEQITHPPKGCQGLRVGQSKGPEHRQGKPKRKKVSVARLRLADWTILLTNVPAEQLSVQEALVLVRSRWQIELFWKLCKQLAKLDTWRSYQPHRILTEISAKLLGVLVSHWQTVVGCWQAPNRSLVKAKQVVEWMAPCLGLALAGMIAVQVVVERTTAMMSKGCTIASRKKQPNTYQLLANPHLSSS